MIAKYYKGKPERIPPTPSSVRDDSVRMPAPSQYWFLL